ncbi:response regulator [Rhizobium sp. AB2/73]|uniref:response regulator transcription factor n=1 Tax=Rhizobium sp. AB2/73 TaxID=2795216 RepID=UPI000DD5CBB3|nr:response regulator [Rhizobium sp. AB2/73]QYA17438.1 response regulator [Rhizobium sp. AB2/73]UEQ85759.1 response regulator [Rhizobium sp. AB2/73]
MKNVPVAIVEDDPAVRKAYCDLFASYDCETVLFESAELFLEYLESADVVCVVLDQRLPGMSGLELQARISAARNDIKTIFITSQDDEMTKRRAIEGGASAFISKAADVDEIVRSVFRLAGRSV